MLVVDVARYGQHEYTAEESRPINIDAQSEWEDKGLLLHSVRPNLHYNNMYRFLFTSLFVCWAIVHLLV